MASDNLPPTTCADQPGLRPFIVYDRLPAGCVPYAVTDGQTEPLLHPGEIAIVDPSDREPQHGELFVIEYGRGTRRASKSIVHVRLRDSIAGYGWWVSPYHRPRTLADGEKWAAAGAAIVCSDGPYRDDEEGRAYLADKLIGRVIGILEARFEEPKRLTSG